MRRGSCVCARPSFPFLGSHANSTSYELLSPENDVYEALCVLLLQAKRSACFLLGAWLHPWTRTAWLVSFNHDGFCRSFGRCRSHWDACAAESVQGTFSDARATVKDLKVVPSPPEKETDHEKLWSSL
ncbi:hypothetical protein TGRUB_241175 [Toxoplasma gondii RUB]|uniref:Uncharacterized protein n=2 Tax=Toxoplasma gondii TaxID=5811 RepID=A0A2G8Y5P9_TOXGO|nr:hypothetical protein TGRUB_241175 [Toxoplasma gondii RUB]PIM02597.1 hypothetical protein TGCOUG_241175 [Toxoplasma gondii COUG]